MQTATRSLVRLLAVVAATGLLAAGCSGGSDDETADPAPAADQDPADADGDATDDSSRNKAVQEIRDLQLSDPSSPFSDAEATCIAERTVEGLTDAEVEGFLAGQVPPPVEAGPDGGPPAEMKACIDSLGWLERLFAQTMTPEAVDCIVDRADKDLAYDYAVAPFLDDAPIPPEQVDAMLAHIEACDAA